MKFICKVGEMYKFKVSMIIVYLTEEAPITGITFLYFLLPT